MVKPFLIDSHAHINFNPYKDDTTVDFFTQFDQNQSFSLTVFVANDSSVAGEYELGSVVGMYFPNCILTEKVVGDQDGILIENLTFSANRGEDGASEEIFMGFV